MLTGYVKEARQVAEDVMVQCRESDRRNGKRRASLSSSGNGEYQSEEDCDGCLSRRARSPDLDKTQNRN